LSAVDVAHTLAGMRRPLLVATSLLALLVTWAKIGSTEGLERGSGSSSPPPIERYLLGGTDVLVVSGADSPVVAICVAAQEAVARSAPDPFELARRGGTEHDERVEDGSLWCATLPSSELAFALWVSAHLRPRPTERVPADDDRATTPIDGARRARDLSFEGAVVTESFAPRHVISIAGSASGREVAALASRYWGGISEPPSIRPPPWSLHQNSERLTVVDGPEERPRVWYGWSVPDSGAGIAAAIDIAFEVLAGDDEARLPALLVPRGLSRRVSRWSRHEKGGAFFGVVIESTTRASVDRVRRFVDGSLRQLRLVGPSTREVSRACAQMHQRALETWENLQERAAALAVYERERGDARRWGEELEGLATVTAERVRSAAHERIVDERRTTLEIYPKLWPTDDPAVSRHRLYTVAAGDTLEDVALRFHIDALRLARDNDVDPKYRLVPGQPLWIRP
jgi:hypothetical protein